MVERGQHLRLALEAREKLRVAGKRLEEHLERNLTVQPGIAGAIDLAHFTFAKRRHDFVHTDTAAAGEAHAGAIV
jgi:hypothetical protein